MTEFDYERFQDDEYEAACGRPLFSQAIPRDVVIEPIPVETCPSCGLEMGRDYFTRHVQFCKLTPGEVVAGVGLARVRRYYADQIEDAAKAA